MILCRFVPDDSSDMLYISCSELSSDDINWNSTPCERPKYAYKFTGHPNDVWDLDFLFNSVLKLRTKTMKRSKLRITIPLRGKSVGDRWRRKLSWWRHQMETFSALLVICAGNSPVPAEFPAQRPVTRSFDVFFDLRLNKRLSKQPRGWWFQTLSRPLWRHRNDECPYISHTVSLMDITYSAPSVIYSIITHWHHLQTFSSSLLWKTCMFLLKFHYWEHHWVR